MIDSGEENMAVKSEEDNEQVPIIQRIIGGRLYTVKIHFRKEAGRTAKATMKSVLMHEVDSDSDFNDG